jgi:hypothetical protein
VNLPLYAALRRSSGPVLVLAVRLGGSDLAFRTVFPILVTNALNHFAGRGAEQPDALASGSAARIMLRMLSASGSAAAVGTGDVRSVLLRSPGGIERRVRAVAAEGTGASGADADGGWLLITEPLLETGIWEVASEDGPVSASAVENTDLLAELAVNAVAESEVDLRPDKSASTSAEETGISGGRWFSGSTFAWLVLLILTLLIADWALYQRRWLA